MGKAINVQIIDDNEQSREGYRRVLETAGYKVKAFGDPVSALEMLIESESSLVLLNCNMPNSPCEVLVPKIRLLRPAIVIVLMSGGSNLRERARLLDIDHALIMPFEPDVLVAVLNKILKEKH